MKQQKWKAKLKRNILILLDLGSKSSSCLFFFTIPQLYIVQVFGSKHTQPICSKGCCWKFILISDFLQFSCKHQEPPGCCPRLTFKIQIHWQIDVGSDLWKPSPISCSPGGSIQLCCLEQPNPELLQTLRHGHVPGFVSDISPLHGENS